MGGKGPAQACQREEIYGLILSIYTAIRVKISIQRHHESFQSYSARTILGISVAPPLHRLCIYLRHDESPLPSALDRRDTNFTNWQVFVILRALKPLKVLSLIWVILIFTTIIIPGIALSYLPTWTAGNLVVRIITYIVWVVIAVYSVAFAVRDYRAKADQRVDRSLKRLSQDIKQANDNCTRTARDLAGLVDRVNDMDSNMRDGFNKLGVQLPPRRILLRGEVTFEPMLTTSHLTSREQSKVVRFCRWVNAQALRFWKSFYG